MEQEFAGPMSMFDEIPLPNVPSEAKPVTVNLLLGKVAQKAQRHHQPYLREKTHLQMADKNLSTVCVPDSQEPNKNILASQCPNLMYIYLENNFLTEMTGAFRGLANLVQINLHNNQIAVMDCFEECTQLRKLYLEHNRICRLEGL